MRTTNKQIVLSGLFLALGLVLPFLTGQIPSIGSRLLPMHIPVLLCGFICGGPFGLLVGFITPLLRSVIFSMPPMFPIAVSMSFELAAYGFFSGLLYSKLPKRKLSIYVSLLVSMVIGRIIWGLASYIIFGLGRTEFTWDLFIAGALINAIPGIVIQIIIIPLLVCALNRVTNDGASCL